MRTRVVSVVISALIVIACLASGVLFGFLPLKALDTHIVYQNF